MKGLTFNALRGTAVIMLSRSGCGELEKAAITCHTLRNVKSFLKKHYFKPDPQLALNAITRLARRTSVPERALQPTA